jgi:hypothetical protein
MVRSTFRRACLDKSILSISDHFQRIPTSGATPRAGVGEHGQAGDPRESAVWEKEEVRARGGNGAMRARPSSREPLLAARGFMISLQKLTCRL